MRRRSWLLLPLGFFIVAGLSAFLVPDPLGRGTHRALGLPECLFLHWTGLPCPGCGLTTSFAWLAQGEWRRAFEAHPLGPLIFMGFGFAALFAVIEFFGRATPLSFLARGRGLGFAYAALTIYLGTWALRWLMPRFFFL